MFDSNNVVSKRINFIMIELGLNQNQLAKKLNITQPAISKYLNGRVPPPFVLLHLSKLSGKSIEWILTGKHERITPVHIVSETLSPYSVKKSFEEKINLLPADIKKSIENLIDSILKN